MELHTARQIAGITQQELAKRAGVTDSFISLLESGKRDILNVAYGIVVRIARDGIGVAADQLFPVPPASADADDDVDTPRAS
jgi:transcriptional regulator with XRE-family HTH domain